MHQNIILTSILPFLVQLCLSYGPVSNSSGLPIVDLGYELHQAAFLNVGAIFVPQLQISPLHGGYLV
jgi:hypothetical protein